MNIMREGPITSNRMGQKALPNTEQKVRLS